MIKIILEKMFEQAVGMNRDNILQLLEKNTRATLLDLGCDNGSLTLDLKRAIGTRRAYGVDIVTKRLREASKKDIKTKKMDLNKRFTLKTNFFDVVHANQVIEHLYNSDLFLSEIYRILKPGGYAIISTENASSWCNIAASILGWQIFSLTNFSAKKRTIGNPFALHREESNLMSSWQHVRIYNYRGLKEYPESFGFVVEKIVGAGYFPLPSSIASLDPMHAHFITMKIRKPS